MKKRFWLLVLIAGILVATLLPLSSVAKAPDNIAPVKAEIVDLRQENSKTFDLGGRKKQLIVSMGAIHYKDDYASGEPWKDIDLTWQDNKITKAPYELTLEGKKLTIRDKKSDEVSTIELLSVFPAGLNYEIIAENSAVRFRHTLPSEKIPFEANFKVNGKGLFTTKAFDDEGEIELETTVVGDILTEKVKKIVDKMTHKVRPAKGNIRIDPTWQVGASTDDAFRRLVADYWGLSFNYLIAGADSAANYQYGCGMRFLNITIPQGSTIDEAYFTLRSAFTSIGNVVNTRISAEDVDDAATFADDSAAFDTRWAARTTARVDWDDIDDWTANVDYNSPECKTVEQELVDSPTWVSGGDQVWFWDDFEDRTAHTDLTRGAFSYDGSTTYCPQLVVSYTYTAPSTFVPRVEIW